jgi:hypothetical protein
MRTIPVTHPNSTFTEGNQESRCVDAPIDLKAPACAESIIALDSACKLGHIVKCTSAPLANANANHGDHPCNPNH